MKKLSLLFVVFVSLIALSACGKEDKVKVQGITDTEVKVANCASQSGGMENVGIPFNAGIQAYFNMINEQGGVNGRKINFITEDDTSNPATAKACIKKMMNDEKVFAIVGHFGSNQIGATLKDLKNKGIPVVYFASGLSSLYNENAKGDDRGIFPVQPILVTEGRLMVARAVAETNAKKIGVIYTSDEAGEDMLAGIENQIKKLGSGYSVVKAEATVGSSDHTAAVTKIKEANVDAIIVASIQGTFPSIIKELVAKGVNKPVFTTYNNAAASIIEDVKADLIANDQVKFDVYANAWVDLTDLDAVTKFATYTALINPEYAANAYTMAGWIAGHFFVEGLKNHATDKEITWQSYMDALEAQPIKNPFGGYIDFSNGQRLGTAEMSLLKIQKNASGAWEFGQVKPMANINEILGE